MAVLVKKQSLRVLSPVNASHDLNVRMHKRSKSTPLSSNTLSHRKSQQLLPKGDSTNIEVVVRLRGLLPREKDHQHECLAHTPVDGDYHKISLIPKDSSAQSKKYREPKLFEFDRCYNSFDDTSACYASQLNVFKNTGEKMVNNTLEGFNSCILAYGQTGSGKTYTMMGTKSNPGLIPLVCKDLLNKLNKMVDTKHELTLSFFEIYQETAYDLLNDQKNQKLRVREGTDKIPFLENLSEYPIASADDAQRWINKGIDHRTTAATNLNTESSRSHSILTLKLVQEKFNPENSSIVKLTSNLRLVDLAGSEKSIATEGLDAKRLKEGNKINKSLTTLGRVLTLLSENSHSKNNILIPYRESMLTWLLKDNIGGNSKTTMVACISPTDFDESLSTLRFATITSKICNHAILNEESQTNLNDVIEKYEIEKQDLLEHIKNLESFKSEMEDSVANLSVHETDLEDLQNEISEKKDTIRKLNNYVSWQNKYIETISFQSKIKEGKLKKNFDNLKSAQEQLLTNYVVQQQQNAVNDKLENVLQDKLTNDKELQFTTVQKIDELILQVEDLSILRHLSSVQDDLDEIANLPILSSDDESDSDYWWDNNDN
ncbi:unnamed protein product [Ambrosiozyma monospora]|uniref:Unnamed protein product n=1 Tax=Ambrosiozyma monospora TaxID=43982 RepID=A0A9W7DH93_AMBMO|nr:unnamed protein product [Ambrosiozyma monospora]